MVEGKVPVWAFDELSCIVTSELGITASLEPVATNWMTTALYVPPSAGKIGGRAERDNSTPGVSANVMVNVISAPKHASGIVGVMTMNLLFLPLWSIIVIAAGGSGGAFFFIRRKSLTGSADYGIDEEV